MNHPLYDQSDSDEIDRLNSLNLSLPASAPLQPSSSTPTTNSSTATASIKPCSSPLPRRRPPPLVEPLDNLPQPIYPILRSPSSHHHLPSSKNNLNLTLKQFTNAIQKSKLRLNRLIKRKKLKPSPNPSPKLSTQLPNPTSFSLHPPIPNSSSTSRVDRIPSNPRCSSFHVDRHQHLHPSSLFRSRSPHRDNLSATSISPIDLNSPIGCRHSGTSSTEFSWRLSHHQPDGSPTHSPWFGRFTRPRTMIGASGVGGWSDRNSVQTTLTSLVGTSPSSLQSRPLGSACPRRLDCFSRFSPANPTTHGLLQPVFGISVREALELSRETYDGLFGRSEIPTIAHKCVERLKCSEGMKSRGIFRINGNVKRMRQLESIFMDPTLGYGKRFDITLSPSHFPPNTHSSLVDRVNPSETEQDTQVGPYFSLHDVAGVLRRYLWALPEPLVPYKATIELIMAWRRIEEGRAPGKAVDGLEEHDHRLKTIEELERILREQMRREELDLLHYLLELLGLFSIRSEDNLMNSKNLAIVFQPGIMPILSDKDHPSQGEEEEDNPRPPPSISSLSNHRYPPSFERSTTSRHHPPTIISTTSQASIHAPTDPGTVEGIGLKEYLVQIDEVQEILRSLIDRFASLTVLASGAAPHQDDNGGGGGGGGEHEAGGAPGAQSPILSADHHHPNPDIGSAVEPAQELSYNCDRSLKLTGDDGG